MTKVFEIRLPQQKYVGGFDPPRIKATIQGNAPRGKLWLWKRPFDMLFEAPQTSSKDEAEVSSNIANAMIEIIFLIIFFFFELQMAKVNSK